MRKTKSAETQAQAQSLDGYGLSKRIRSVGLIQIHQIPRSEGPGQAARDKAKQAHHNTKSQANTWHERPGWEEEELNQSEPAGSNVYKNEGRPVHLISFPSLSL